MGNDVPNCCKVADEPTMVIFSDTAGAAIHHTDDFKVKDCGVILLFSKRPGKAVFIPWHRVISIVGTPMNVERMVTTR